MPPEPANDTSLDHLLPLLSRMPALRRREDTLFSIGGRGYYENPTSDVLAYFLRPCGQHGFGPLFLRTFVSCMGIEHPALSLEGVRVERERRTEGGRIDILVIGKTWVLIIENKIRHWLANNLAEYEDYVRRFYPGRQVFLAILSPDKADVAGWTSIAYRDYCAALNVSVETYNEGEVPSKWKLFAYDFVTHLEGEIYGIMIELQPQHIEFIEENMRQLAEVNQLTLAYKAHLLRELVAALASIGPEQSFESRDDNWAFVFIDAENTEFYFRTVIQDNAQEKSRTGVWVKRLNSIQRELLKGHLEPLGFSYSEEEGGGWDIDCNTLQDTKEMFCAIAKALVEIRGVGTTNAPA